MSDSVESPGRICSECGKGHFAPISRDEPFDFDLGDETIHVVAHAVPVEQCDVCGAEASGPAAARVRHDAVCKAADFFSPDAVRQLRRELDDMSQDEFARLAGVGVATVSRVERGRLLQNRSTDNLFFLIANSAEARNLLRARLAAHGHRRNRGASTSPEPAVSPLHPLPNRHGRFQTGVDRDPLRLERSKSFQLFRDAA